MPNRQRGKSSRPAAGLRPADSRTARTVQVSRAPGTPTYTEPEMRRWPHPLEDPAPSPAPEPAMHYISWPRAGHPLRRKKRQIQRKICLSCKLSENILNPSAEVTKTAAFRQEK